MILSDSDEAFFIATCDNDEHCSMDAIVTLLYCRVSNCDLSLFLHVAGDYDGVLENTFAVLEKSRNLFGQDNGNPG